MAKHRSSYYVRLQEADQPRRGDYDGRGQLTERGLFEFIDFMLDVCLEQVDYMIQSLDPLRLRERLDVIVRTDPQVIEADIRPEAAEALHALIRRGYVRHADFESDLGLEGRAAAMQLAGLMQLGLVSGGVPGAGHISPRLPGWFAQKLFPDLYARFS